MADAMLAISAGSNGGENPAGIGACAPVEGVKAEVMTAAYL
jgi:hypothetical protein